MSDSESDLQDDRNGSVSTEIHDLERASPVKPSKSEYADYRYLARQIRRDTESPIPDDPTDIIIASTPKVISAALKALLDVFPLEENAINGNRFSSVPRSNDDPAINALLRARWVGTARHSRSLRKIDWEAVNTAFSEGHDERLTAALAPLRVLLKEPSPIRQTTSNVFARRAAVLQKAREKANQLDSKVDLLADHKRPPRPIRGRPKPKEPVAKNREKSNFPQKTHTPAG